MINFTPTNALGYNYSYSRSSVRYEGGATYTSTYNWYEASPGQMYAQTVQQARGDGVYNYNAFTQEFAANPPKISDDVHNEYPDSWGQAYRVHGFSETVPSYYTTTYSKEGYRGFNTQGTTVKTRVQVFNEQTTAEYGRNNRLPGLDWQRVPIHYTIKTNLSGRPFNIQSYLGTKRYTNYPQYKYEQQALDQNDRGKKDSTANTPQRMSVVGNNIGLAQTTIKEKNLVTQFTAIVNSMQATPWKAGTWIAQEKGQYIYSYTDYEKNEKVLVKNLEVEDGIKYISTVQRVTNQEVGINTITVDNLLTYDNSSFIGYDYEEKKYTTSTYNYFPVRSFSNSFHNYKSNEIFRTPKRFSTTLNGELYTQSYTAMGANSGYKFDWFHVAKTIVDNFLVYHAIPYRKQFRDYIEYNPVYAGWRATILHGQNKDDIFDDEIWAFGNRNLDWVKREFDKDRNDRLYGNVRNGWAFPVNKRLSYQNVTNLNGKYVSVGEEAYQLPGHAWETKGMQYWNPDAYTNNTYCVPNRYEENNANVEFHKDQNFAKNLSSTGNAVSTNDNGATDTINYIAKTFSYVVWDEEKMFFQNYDQIYHNTLTVRNICVPFKYSGKYGNIESAFATPIILKIQDTGMKQYFGDIIVETTYDSNFAFHNEFYDQSMLDSTGIAQSKYVAYSSERTTEEGFTTVGNFKSFDGNLYNRSIVSGTAVTAHVSYSSHTLPNIEIRNAGTDTTYLGNYFSDSVHINIERNYAEGDKYFRSSLYGTRVKVPLDDLNYVHNIRSNTSVQRPVYSGQRFAKAHRYEKIFTANINKDYLKKNLRGLPAYEPEWELATKDGKFAKYANNIAVSRHLTSREVTRAYTGIRQMIGFTSVNNLVHIKTGNGHAGRMDWQLPSTLDQHIYSKTRTRHFNIYCASFTNAQ